MDNNNPDDEYLYVVVVYTGLGSVSGTTSNVVIQLIGTEATSKVLRTQPESFSVLKLIITIIIFFRVMS